jgi:hypothetical protein
MKTLVLGNLWSGGISYVHHTVIFAWEDLTEQQVELIECGGKAAMIAFRKLPLLSSSVSILEETYGNQRSI